MNNNDSSPEGDSRPLNNGAEKKKILGKVRSLFKKESDQSLKSELQEILQEHEDGGSVIAQESTILRNVLKFDELRVTDVMTPRLDICAVPAGITLDELKVYIDENEHTRIPVFDKNLDDVVGFLHIKDLIAFWIKPREFKLHEILREVLFVPPTMKINNLLIKMQSERTHMAIVVDEYGGTSGLVTIEDLVEQIVGEIDDEHDEENQEELIQTGKDTFEALSRLQITKLEEIIGVRIYQENAESDYDTIGGLIFSELGKIPRIGESYSHPNGLIFKVIDADKRRIKRIKITKTAPVEEIQATGK